MSVPRPTLPSPQGPTTATFGDIPFSINSVRYLAAAPVEHWPQDWLLEDQDDFSLVTIFNSTAGGDSLEDAVTEDWVKDIVHQYESKDDVFQTAFLSTVFVSIPHALQDQNHFISEGARRFLQGQGTKSIHGFLRSDLIQPGPYVIVQNSLRHVWRLYDDSHGTFMTALLPRKGPFVELKLLGSDPSFSAVAVPSRITRQPTKEKPLNGMRFAVKDIYHLEGVRTSFGSRSYYNTYGPQPETAEAVTKLQDLGAVVLGKLKLTQYGAWEEPVESIDYQAPWNPRADGFQSPAGSSSGPACALAAYEWLDITLGSDTTGSILRPGLWGGLFGLRPTWNAVSYKGMGAAVEELDMAGCYARSLQGLRDFSDLWLEHDKLTADPKPFTSIIWVSDMWDPVDKDQQELARKFVKDLETHLGIKTTDLSFEQVWNKKPPDEANNSSLSDYINKACDDIFYEYFHRFDDFVDRHQKKFGFPPYLSPANIDDWELFQNVTEEQWKEAVKRVDVYRKWFWDKIFQGESSNALFVLPIEYLAPRYRDEKPDFRRPPPGVNSLTLSPVMKTPELVIPIGEIPYQSKITKQEEKLPFAVGVMGLPGTDLFLMDTLQDVLKKSGRPLSVGTGKWMFKCQEKPSWLGGIDTNLNVLV